PRADQPGEQAVEPAGRGRRHDGDGAGGVVERLRRGGGWGEHEGREGCQKMCKPHIIPLPANRFNRSFPRKRESSSAQRCCCQPFLRWVPAFAGTNGEKTTPHYCEPAMPAFLTMSPQRTISDFTKACICSTDGVSIGSRLSFAICAFMSALPIA